MPPEPDRPGYVPTLNADDVERIRTWHEASRTMSQGRPEMGARVDHLVVGCADLDAGARWVEQRLGVAPVAGGVHDGFGTRNALLGLGDAYLEVLALDPAQTGASSPLRERIAGLTTPTLVTLAVAMSGLRNGVPMSRVRPDGIRLEWELAPHADVTPKVASDLLRAACRRGHVHRLARGRYMAGHVPRSTEWSMRHHPAVSLPRGKNHTQTSRDAPPRPSTESNDGWIRSSDVGFRDTEQPSARDPGVHASGPRTSTRAGAHAPPQPLPGRRR